MKKITREDVVNTFNEFYPPEGDGDDDIDYDKEEFDSSDVIDFLEYLDVPDAAHRVRMYNISTFDIDDILALANVQFAVVVCDRCGAEVYVVQPDNWGKFQGIYTNGEIGPLEIGGHEGEFCGECYGYLMSLVR